MCSFSVRSLPVLGATVNADPIVLSDDVLDVLDVPLFNELGGSAINMQPGKLSHYNYE